MSMREQGPETSGTWLLEKEPGISYLVLDLTLCQYLASVCCSVGWDGHPRPWGMEDSVILVPRWWERRGRPFSLGTPYPLSCKNSQALSNLICPFLDLERAPRCAGPRMGMQGQIPTCQDPAQGSKACQNLLEKQSLFQNLFPTG